MGIIGEGEGEMSTKKKVEAVTFFVVPVVGCVTRKGGYEGELTKELECSCSISTYGIALS